MKRTLIALPLLLLAGLLGVVRPAVADPRPTYVVAFVPINWQGSQADFAAAVQQQADLFLAESQMEQYADVQVEALASGLTGVDMTDPMLDYWVAEYGLRQVPADRYVGLTDGDLALGGDSGVVGWTSGPGALSVVGEAPYIEVTAHELGHTYLLCDEYSYPAWSDENATWGCPNPFPSACSKNGYEMCPGAPAPDGRNSIMGYAGQSGGYAFNQPSYDHLQSLFREMFLTGANPVEPPVSPEPTPAPPPAPLPALILGGSTLVKIDPMLGEQVLVDGEAQHPAWSPDGKWIVYASAKSRDMELYRVSADGGRPERLTDSPGRDWHPAWLSDEQIVFATERDGVEQLAVLHLADGSVTLLQGLPVPASWPAVSPDGTWLAFSAAPQGDWDLYRVNLDGGQAVPDTLLILTQSAGAEIAPAWHPSGQGLVFAASRSGSLNLYAITNGGQSESLLLSSGYHLWAPSWLADGRLLFQTFEGGAMKIGLLDLVDGSVTSVETGLTEPAWPISQPMGR